MDQFEYTTLPSGSYLRIIELQPGPKEDVIKCNLATELRHEATDSYDAISYVWGDGKDAEIICNDKAMRITTNLANALRTIRAMNPNRPTRLWADAISINQEDTEEKNHQVKSMGSVYENARQLHVWLGTDEFGISHDLFDTIRMCIHHLHAYKDPSKVPYITSDFNESPDRGRNSTTLLSLPWFTRVWVVQEVALSKHAQLHWGNATLDFADLIELACLYDGSSKISNLLGGYNLTLRFLKTLFRCVYRTYGKTEFWGSDKPYYFKRLSDRHPLQSGLFLDVLIIGKALNASENKDHIYAFLGSPLSLYDEGRTVVEPDYSKSEEEVNLELADTLLKSPESPYVLCFVQHGTADEVTGSKGPSWVPRWRTDTAEWRPTFTIGNIGLGYRAGGSPEKMQFQIRDAKVLNVQGLVFDQLSWTSEKLRSRNFRLDSDRWDDNVRTSRMLYVEALWKEVSQACKSYLEFPKDPDQACYEDDFSYTLVTGYNNPRVIGLKEHRRIFKAYTQVLQAKLNAQSMNKGYIVSPKKDTEACKFESHTRNCSTRRFAITKSGGFALVPKYAQPGDTCALLSGMSTPFILRPAEVRLHGQGHHHLVGEAYVYGTMHGELVNELEQDQGEISLI